MESVLNARLGKEDLGKRRSWARTEHLLAAGCDHSLLSVCVQIVQCIEALCVSGLHTPVQDWQKAATEVLRALAGLFMNSREASHSAVHVLRVALRSVTVLVSELLSLPFGMACVIDSGVIGVSIHAANLALTSCSKVESCSKHETTVDFIFDIVMGLLTLLCAVKAIAVKVQLADQFEQESGLPLFKVVCGLLDSCCSSSNGEQQAVLLFTQLVNKLASFAVEMQLPELGFVVVPHDKHLPDDELGRNLLASGSCLSSRLMHCLLELMTCCRHDATLSSILNALTPLPSCSCMPLSTFLSSALKPFPHVGYLVGQLSLTYLKRVVLQPPVYHPADLSVVSKDSQSSSPGLADNYVVHWQQSCSQTDSLPSIYHDSLHAYYATLRCCSTKAALCLLKHLSEVGDGGHGFLRDQLLSEVVVPQLIGIRSLVGKWAESFEHAESVSANAVSDEDQCDVEVVQASMLVAAELLSTGSAQRQFLEHVSASDMSCWLGIGQVSSYALPICEQLLSTCVQLLQSVSMADVLKQLNMLSPPHHQSLLGMAEQSMQSPQLSGTAWRACDVASIVRSGCLASLFSQWLHQPLVQQALELFGGSEQLLELVRITTQHLVHLEEPCEMRFELIQRALVERLKACFQIVSAALQSRWDPDQVSNVCVRACVVVCLIWLDV